MTKQEFINKVHAAQTDAGTQVNFNWMVTTSEETMDNLKYTDPVALFIAAILHNNGGKVNEDLFDDISFFSSEISRIAAQFPR